MKFIFFTNCISPHQVPLAKAIIRRLGGENYRYVYTDALTEERLAMGWGDVLKEQDSVYIQGCESDASLVDANILMSEERTITLFQKRLYLGKKCIYSSERWFKPPLGFMRVFVPSYFKMAWHFVQCFKRKQFECLPQGVHSARDLLRVVSFLNGDFRCLFRAPKVAFESRPGGAIVPLKEAIEAGVLSVVEIAFGQQHGFVQIPRGQWGKVEPQKVYAKMRMWGYFVAPGRGEKPQNTQNTQKMCSAGPFGQDNGDDLTTNDTNLHEFLETTRICAQAQRVGKYTEGVVASQLAVSSNQLAVGDNVRLTAPDSTSHEPRATSHRTLRVLWVGRMLDWKRVDTLVKACASEALKDKVELHLYGHGPEEEKLKRLAEVGNNVFFHDFVPVAQVRDLMRAHDVYVLPSDGGEGWGAVVSEALEEGMKVLGTVEAGSSATILPPTHLFKAGDVKRLIGLLSQEIEQISIGEWSAKNAANTLGGVFNETSI